MKAIKEILRKYAKFSGRASRAEYLGFNIFVILVSVMIVLAGTDFVKKPLEFSYAAVLLIFLLFSTLPLLAVGVRRLHDTGRSGWWILLWGVATTCKRISEYVGSLDVAKYIILISYVFVIWFFAYMFTRGDKGANRYGEDPRG